MGKFWLRSVSIGPVKVMVGHNPDIDLVLRGSRFSASYVKCAWMRSFSFRVMRTFAYIDIK